MNTQQQQFEQNEQLISHLQGMRRKEFIKTDPRFRYDLKNKIISSFSQDQNIIEQSHHDGFTFRDILAHLASKLTYSLKMIPALLMLFVVFFSVKNLYLDPTPTSEIKAPEPLATEAPQMHMDQSTMDNESAPPMPQPTEPEISPEINFFDINSTDQDLITQEILMPLQARIIGEIEIIHVRQANDILFVTITTSKNQFIYSYAKNEQGWQSISAEKTAK